ncbi:MAG: carotenoid oxygenase family protein [Steroidobacteraceae bacterium]
MNRRAFLAASAGSLVAAGSAAAAAATAPENAAATGSATAPPAAAPRNAPLRFDASIDDCEVLGKIPADLEGAFYRVGYEWFYPPSFADDAVLNADGYASMFRFKGGKVDYRGRWVETHRLQQLRKARRQLYGYYRNPYTDDPSIRDAARPNLRTVANTSPLVQGGKLFALKEDGLPHQLDPNTLATIGPWDFQGKWQSQTFTAHPKLDPVSGQMISFGYEATGLASDDLWICTHDRAGNVQREVRTKVPYVSVIHDMAITQKHVLIPFGGYVSSRERLLAGKVHWGWDDTKPAMIGVLPRDGDARDMRWFKGPLRCLMHTFNAQDEKNGRITLYAPFWDSNFFPFFPPVDGKPWNPAGARAFIRKITLDMNSRKDTWTEEILWPMQVSDLGKVDPRVLSLPTRYAFTGFSDTERPLDRARIGSSAPASVTNSYGRFDLATGRLERYYAGATHNLQEPSFVPRRGGGEGDGYLVGVAENLAERRAELVIADAQHLADGDVARVVLPFRISPQVHGVWADASELPLT